jgi:hypothetical protein
VKAMPPSRGDTQGLQKGMDKVVICLFLRYFVKLVSRTDSELPFRKNLFLEDRGKKIGALWVKASWINRMGKIFAVL